MEYMFLKTNTPVEEIGVNLVNRFGGLDCFDSEALKMYFDYRAFGQHFINSGEIELVSRKKAIVRI